MNTSSLSANEAVMIPLNRLRKSEMNVRKAKVDGEYRKRLKASVLSQGLLENLIVAPCKHKANFYEVGGGGNRLAVLQELVADKAIAADFPVPCVVKSREELAEISLSENIHAPMHPADEFEGYRAMQEGGHNPKEIARRFGQSEKKVKKLLKLASVAPEILEQFRAGKMDLDCVMAFTVSDDHERQIVCWKEVSKGYRSPHGIRSYLMESALSSDDAIMQFVGLDRYRKAGGSITTDLFSSNVYVLDRALVEQLASESLNKAAEALRGEGWKWVEIAFDFHSAVRDCLRLTAELGSVPEALSKALSTKVEALELYEEKDWDELTDEDSTQMEALEKEVEAIEAQVEAYRAFTGEQKLVGGCVVSFRDDGVLQVARGLVKKEDRKLLVKEDISASQSDGGGGVATPEAVAGMTNALRADLDTYYAQAFQAELMRHPDLAYELMAYALATSVLFDEGFGSGLGLSCRPADHRAIGIEDTKAGLALAQRKSDLLREWADIEDGAARFAAFRQMGKQGIAEVVAYCVARISVASPGEAADGVLGSVGRLMGFSVGKYWVPTAENYFGRIKKEYLLSIGESVIGLEFRKQYRDSKKGELAGVMEALPALHGWLPSHLQQ